MVMKEEWDALDKKIEIWEKLQKAAKDAKTQKDTSVDPDDLRKTKYDPR